MPDAKPLPDDHLILPKPVGAQAHASALLRLKALAQPTRIELFRTLYGSPQGIDFDGIAQLYGGPRSSVSLHLAVLSRSRLITGERQQGRTVYRVNQDVVEQLLAYLFGAPGTPFLQKGEPG